MWGIIGVSFILRLRNVVPSMVPRAGADRMGEVATDLLWHRIGKKRRGIPRAKCFMFPNCLRCVSMEDN